MNIKEWNEDSYKEYIDYLFSIQDLKYKEFNKSLSLRTKYEMIGIKVPVLRKLAKEISKSTNIYDYLKVCKSKYYEEVLMEGYIISFIKDEKYFNKIFKEYIKKLDDWSLCDQFCDSIDIVEKYPDKYFKYACKLALNKKEFIARVGIVIILEHFIKPTNYLNDIFELLDSIESDQFYVNMAEAWLLSFMFVYHRNETLKYLEKNKLNKFTQNKAISKIHDSFRVSKEDKEYVTTLRYN
jgi:3-methyladenine DNA glycosylase AlkD